MFEEQLQATLNTEGAGKIALLHIGLDRFDTVHEALGPRAAEQILIETAQRLTRDGARNRYHRPPGP